MPPMTLTRMLNFTVNKVVKMLKPFASMAIYSNRKKTLSK